MDQIRPTNPASFEPSQLADLDDPYPVFRALHAAGPSLQTASGIHCVFGYAAADAILREPKFRTGPIAQRFRQLLPAGAARDELSHRINFLDPPDHPRVRGLVARAFTPARVRDLHAFVARKTEELLDAEPGGGAGDGTIDLRARLAHPLPSLVISEMLGVPLADRDQLTEWTEAVTPLLGVQLPQEGLNRALEASERFAEYAAALLEERRRHPGDDLLTAMVQAKDGQEQLSREELLSLVVTLYSAGHRTTRDLFTNGLFILLQHPDQYAAIVEDSSLVPGAINEFLRFETPTQYVARVPIADVEIAECSVTALTPTLVLLAAANRDPRRFAEPDHFDVQRDEGAPLSFAVGPHHCLGASLARMEAEVMLAAVTRRWRRLTLAGPAPRWWSSGPFRGLNHLRVLPGKETQ
jgi:cytochrome P450